MKIFGFNTNASFPRTFFLLAALFGSGFSLSAQGTAFTYQGRLDAAGTPANGVYDFQFTVKDAPVGGGSHGVFPLSATLPVSNGLFTVTLDPGPGVFTGPARWLDIAVRTNGAPSYTNLSPRQPLTATPYAVRATGAAIASGVTPGAVTSAGLAPGAVHQVSNPSGTINALQVNAAGLIGIGTNAPQAGLHVASGNTIVAPFVLSELRDETDGYTNLANLISIAVLGDLLALGSGSEDAITLISITNPSSPVLLSQFRDGELGFTKLKNVNVLAMNTNLLVAGAVSTNVVTFISISNPAAPVKLAEIEDGIGGWNELAGIFGLAIRGNLLAIAAAEDNAVTLADISNPAAPIKRVEMKDGVFGFNSLSGAVAVAISGNILAIGSFYDSAVTLVDITDPSNPVKLSEIRDEVGGFTNLNAVFKVAFSSNGLLLAISGAIDNAVTLVDVSNPASPVKIAEMIDGVNGVDTLLTPTGLSFSGNWLAVAGGNENAVTVFDISIPSAPRVVAAMRDGVGGFSSLGFPYYVVFAGTNLILPSSSDDAATIISFSTATAGIVSQGRVGIGTSLPRAALDVVGDVIVDNALLLDVNAARIEMGLSSTASGSNAVAIGKEVVASGRSALALGEFTRATGDYSVTMGYNTTASGDYSFAAGNSAEASGAFSVALGNSAKARGDNSFAVGLNAEANGESSVSLGENSVADGLRSLALGFATFATNNAMAAGSQARAEHLASFVWSDNSSGIFATTTNRQFLIRATGGVGINTNRTTNVALNVHGNVTVNGTVTATNFSGRFTGNGVGLTNLPTQGNYVYVYDTSTQTAAIANTYQDVSFDSNGQINGWVRQAGGAYFTNQQAGLYLVEYSAHAETTVAGLSTVSLHAMLNATEVAGSQSAVEPDTANQSLVLSKSFIINAAANATFRLQFAGSVVSNRLIPNQGQGTTRPSVSMTIIRIQ